jgi:uncharacterized protein
MIPEQAVSLRIYFGEQDQYEHKPLYEVLVMEARKMHMAGATVYRSPLGFGHSSLVHSSKILRLSEDLPLVIEMIDGKESIDNFLKQVDSILSETPGLLITRQDVTAKHYGTQI